MTGALDVAFVDRADVKVYIGPPGCAARYAILLSCVRELALRGLIAAHESELPPPWDALPPQLMAAAGGEAPTMLPPGVAPVEVLLASSIAAAGLSGRALRKLPFLACAELMGSAGAMTLRDFLGALFTATCAELAERAAL